MTNIKKTGFWNMDNCPYMLKVLDPDFIKTKTIIIKKASAVGATTCILDGLSRLDYEKSN